MRGAVYAILLALTLPVPAVMGDPQARGSRARPEFAALARPEIRLVTADFSTTGDADPRDAWLPTAVEEMLNWRMQRSRACVVLPSIRVVQARRDAAGEAERLDTEEVFRRLGATHRLRGEVSGPHFKLTLKVVLEPLVSPSVVERCETTLGPGRLLPLLDEAQAWLLGALEVEPSDEAVREVITAPLAQSPSAVEYYARAVEATRDDDLSRAVQLARDAMHYDDSFRPAHLLLAQIELRVSPRTAAQGRARLLSLLQAAQLEGDAIDAAAASVALGQSAQGREDFESVWQRFAYALAKAYEAGDAYGQIDVMGRLSDLHAIRPAPRAALVEDPQRERFRAVNLRRAIAWQQAAVELTAAVGDERSYPAAANKLALLFAEAGELTVSLEWHERALEAARRSELQQSIASSLMFIGQLHRQAGRLTEAERAFRACLEQARSKSRSTVRLALAELYQAVDPPQYDAAREQLEAVLSEIRASGDLINEAMCLRALGELYHRQGRVEAAIQTYQEALDIAEAMQLEAASAIRQRLAELREQR